MTRFTGDNFHLWKFKMQMYLLEKGVWSAVTAKLSDKEVEELDPENDLTAARKDQKAQAYIVLALSDDQLMHVNKCTTAKDTWDTLVKVHEGKSVASKLRLHRELNQLKMDPSDSIITHINKTKILVQQLEAVGSTIAETDVILYLLLSLPADYSAVAVAVETRFNERELTLIEVSEALLQEEARQQANGRAKGNKIGRAFNADGRSGSSRNSGGNGGKKPDWKKSATCHHCNKVGHIKRDCLKLKREQNEGKASIATADKGYLFMARIIETPATFDSGNALTANQAHSNAWVVDSGASQHMTNDRTAFQTYKTVTGKSVQLADNRVIPVSGQGSVELSIQQDNGLVTAVFKDVWHVPGIGKNLISCPQLDSLEASITFGGGKCIIRRSATAKEGIEATRTNGIYVLSATPVVATAGVATSSTLGLELWHQRLGHLNFQAIQRLGKSHSRGLDASGSPPSSCNTCNVSKTTMLPFPKEGATRASQLLGIVHSDVQGPMQTQTWGGGRYTVLFIDDKSRFVFANILAAKSQVFETYKDWELETTTELSARFGRTFSVANLRTDPGGEYMSKAFDTHLTERGTRHQLSIVNTPQQNGVAERMNRTIIEMARCLLQHAGLSHKFWGEAVMTAAYLRNRSPTSAVTSTPHELFYGAPPDLSHLRVFGCLAWAFIQPNKRGKLDGTGEPCLMLGYSTHQKGYRLWHLAQKKIINSRDVRFDETKFLKDIDSASVHNASSGLLEVGIDLEEQLFTLGSKNARDSTASRRQNTLPDPEASDGDEDDFHHAPEVQTPPPPPLRTSGRTRSAPKEYWKAKANLVDNNHMAVAFAVAETMAYIEPRTLKEARSLPDASQWELAMQQELEALNTQNTWTFATLPANRKAVGCKWVFKVKLKADGTIERRKMRLVAKGFSQREGIDYNETYAPVAKFAAVRTVLTVAAVEDMDLRQMDVPNAFVRADLEEEVFLAVPEGVQIPGGMDHLTTVCRLNRPLYGLKQSARNFNDMINSSLIRIGFTRCQADNCIYVLKRQKHTVLLILYVDDVAIASNDDGLLQIVMDHLKKDFDMKDLGPLTYFLGIQIIRDRPNRMIYLSQRRYVQEIITRFNMDSAKPVDTPMEPGLVLSKGQSPTDAAGIQAMSSTPYRSGVGSLVYAMVCTRLDIATAVGIVSRFLANPGTAHWHAVQRIIRYLKGTLDYVLALGGASPDFELQGYSDASYASCIDTRRSTTGFIFEFCGSPVAHGSTRQSVLGDSTTVSEYIALATTAKEAIWLRLLVKEIGYPQKGPTLIFEDNQSALALAKNPVHHNRTKHIDVRFHFIRECIENEQVDVTYLPTDDMKADLLTKPIARDQFRKLRTLCGVIALPAALWDATS